MKSEQRGASYRRLYSYVAAVIFAFLLLLIYALIQLVNIQEEVRDDIGGGMLWATTQAQHEGLRLKAEVLLVQTGDDRVSGDDVFNRYEIFLSRLTLLLTGPQKRYLTDLGELDELLRVVSRFETALPWDDGRMLDVVELKRLHAALIPIVGQLQVLSNRVLLAEREHEGTRRDDHARALFKVIAAVLGILISSAYFSWYLLRDVHRAQRPD